MAEFRRLPWVMLISRAIKVYSNSLGQHQTDYPANINTAGRLKRSSANDQKPNYMFTPSALVSTAFARKCMIYRVLRCRDETKDILLPKWAALTEPKFLEVRNLWHLKPTAVARSLVLKWSKRMRALVHIDKYTIRSNNFILATNLGRLHTPTPMDLDMNS